MAGQYRVASNLCEAQQEGVVGQTVDPRVTRWAVEICDRNAFVALCSGQLHHSRVWNTVAGCIDTTITRLRSVFVCS